MKPSPNWHLNAALALAARGFTIIPISPVRPDETKPPLTKFKYATRDPATIRGWFDRWPDANVGIMTGKVSGIFVFDIDPRNGSDRTLAKLPPLPRTLVARSGGKDGGRHYYFRYVAGVCNRATNKKGKLAGIDIKTDRMYVVAPPSLHFSGRRYRWLNHAPIAPAPQWLIARLRAPPAPPARQVRRLPTVAAKRIDPITRRRLNAKSTNGGDRSLVLRQLECALLEARFTKSQTFQKVHDTPWNKFIGDDDALRADIERAYRHVMKRR